MALENGNWGQPGEGPGAGSALKRILLRWRLARARGRFGQSRFRATRFLYVPPHLHLADPSVATDFLAGQVVLAGRSLLAGGRPILDVASPSRAFSVAFNGFDWLRHFEASADPETRKGARKILSGWLTQREQGRRRDAELPASVPRRVIAWITHSTLLTEGADFSAYRRLLAHLAQDAAMLRVLATETGVGMLRLEAAIALLFHALSLDRPLSAVRQAQDILTEALMHCLAEDGGPHDRNPATAVRLAAAFVPLLALYRARQIPVPEDFAPALFRMIGFIRMMQHPDGGLALFNGAGLVTRDLAAEVMRFGSGRAARLDSAAETGFERLENEHGILIVDTGRLPMPEYAGLAGAGALAFEFSTKSDRIIVNCGIPPSAEGATLRNLRVGAAHSTVMIDDVALVQVHPFENAFGEREDRVVSAEEGLPPQRRRHAGVESLMIGHAGLREKLGYIVERELTLLSDGDGLAGTERAIDVSGKAETRRWTLVFHLHPRIVPVLLSRQDAIVMRLPHQVPGRDMWLFECPGIPLHLEESCCFDQEIALPKTEAIVLDVPISGTTELRWRLAPYRG